jgi:M6 family metalloprotease-like protein
LVLRDALLFMDDILACASDGPGADRTCTTGGDVDFSRFDNAGPNGDVADGVADGVIFVSNAGFPGIALPIKHLSDAELLSFLGPFPEFSYDGVVVGAVAVAGRESAPRRASYVSVHEFGHLLGWCDLYTETGSNSDMPYTVMGGWYYAEAASLPDAYSRAAAGWAHVIQHSGNKKYTIGAAADVGTTIKVGTGDEFFMVELREKRDDVDADMDADRGVLVERVRLQKRPSPEPGSYPGTLANYVNDDPDDAFLIIEQADGLFDLERGRARKDNDDMFKAGDSIGPTDDTAPRTGTHRVFSTNLYDGTRTDITITVEALEDGSATVEIDAPEVSDACAEIANLCGDLPCEDGACGSVTAPTKNVPGGCGCGAQDGSLSALALVCLARVAQQRRRRRQS